MPVRLPYSYVFLVWEWRWKTRVRLEEQSSFTVDGPHHTPHPYKLELPPPP